MEKEIAVSYSETHPKPGKYSSAVFFASEKYKNWLIGKKDEYIYFNYDTKNHTLYYSYYKIYQILSSKYHLNEVKANELVSGMVSEHFKLKVDTTQGSVMSVLAKVSEHFKLKVDTTILWYTLYTI